MRLEVLSDVAAAVVRAGGGDGSVEAVLWLPLFFLTLGLITDATMIFDGYTQALRVLQNANRSLSVGRFTSTAEAESFVETALAPWSAAAAATSSTADGLVTTVVTLPASDLQILGVLSQFNTLTLTVRAQHMIED